MALTTHGFVGAVERLAAFGLPWLAFGGGGYDLDAVPRCWTLAYGVMLGREWPNELPDGSEGFLESQRLRDGEVSVEPDVYEQTRAFAQEQVAEIKRLIFPLHGAT